MDPYIGEIRLFSGNYAPTGWATCDGQLLAIAQNQALFAIIGTTYGGDGKTNFALPDLRGRSAIHRSEEFPQGKGQEELMLSSGPTNMPGFLSVLFIIALQGVFPPRAS